MSELQAWLKKRFGPTLFRHGGYLLDDCSGPGLIKAINELNPRLVIDAGCGHNILKKYINNLIGFDQELYPTADFQSSILDAEFAPGSADVILCLGSLHFGSREFVYKNFEKIMHWLAPGGYVVMRVYESNDVESATNHFYKFTQYDIDFLENLYNLKMVKGPFKRTGNQGTRVVWWWQKQ
jgi:hypothetical protein